MCRVVRWRCGTYPPDTFDECGGRGLHSLVPEVVQFAARSDHLLFQLLLIADKNSNDSTYVGVERYSS